MKTQHFEEYLFLTRGERNGLTALVLIAFAFSVIPQFYSSFYEKEKTDFSVFLNEIENHKKENTNYALTSKTNPSPVLSINYNAELFHFDPNVASKNDFINLGLPEKTAKTIVNYRRGGGIFNQPEDFKKVYNLSEEAYKHLKNHIRIKKKRKSSNRQFAKNESPKSYDHIPLKQSKFDPNNASEKTLLENGIPKRQVATLIKYRNKGGIFYNKESLRKVYGMTDAIYKKIEPYIDIPPKASKKEFAKAPDEKPKKQNYFESSSNLKIDINNASPEEWQQLRGIGPAFSKRIVKFRDALGGFHTVSQVGETFGLPDSTFQVLKPQLVVSSIFKKININQATLDQLKAHPYIKWNEAKLIIAYREMHGEFKNVNELLEIKALNKEWLEKVKIYLRI